MKLQHKYSLKYLLYHALPLLLFICAVSSLFFFGAHVNNSNLELIISVLISSIAFAIFFTYYLFNIISFLHMIKKQEKIYNVSFDVTNSRQLGGKFSLWVICSEKWLISPGKYAIYRGDIVNGSIGESYYEYRTGPIYPVRIKTKSGRTYKVKLRNDENAKFLRKWARK